MTNRQPAGTPIGGQFAEGRKPEGADLTDMPAPVDHFREVLAESRGVIYDAEENIDLILSRYGGSRDDLPRALFSGSDDTDLFNSTMTAMAEQKKIIDEQTVELERLKAIAANKDKELAQFRRAAGGFRLNGAIRDNIYGRIADEDDVDELSDERKAQIDELVDQHFDRFDPADNNILYEVTSAETDLFMDRLDLETMTLKTLGY